MSDFPRALAFTLSSEGGYVNDADDPGGATNKGVTQAVYDTYRKAASNPVRSVKLITDAEVQAIYRTRYWDAAKCPAFSWPLNAVVFDAAVNTGVKQATKLLQRAAGVTDDGVCGPKTLAAVSAIDPKQLAMRVCDQRMAFYRSLIGEKPVLAKFSRGWSRRVTALRALIGG